jgi:hypothetical protein
MFKVRETNNIGNDVRTEEFVGLLAETRINIRFFRLLVLIYVF